MDERFGAVSLNNSSLLCIGSVTRYETEAANAEGLAIDGFGYYLFIADQAEPEKPIEILAKFASAAAAERLLRLIPPAAFAT